MYTVKNLDVAAFEKALKDSRNFQRDQMLLKREKAESYFNGWEECMHRVIDMLHCSNYEKAEGVE